MIEITSDMYNGIEYNGSESKCGVTINGIRYILKRQKKFWNNVTCEHVASTVINVLGGNAHETALAVEDGELVVLCRDFTQYIGDFHTIRAVHTSSFDTDRHKREYYFDDVVYGLSKLKDCDVESVVKRFLEMYVYDTILGNTDRHQGNWGICYTPKGKVFSPIFDNGACLFPRSKYSDISCSWIKERIYVWPNSKIMFDRRERSSYVQVWKDKRLPEYAIDYANSLDISKAIDWIYSTDLTDVQKWFYSAIIWYRYNVIIKGKEVSRFYD